MDFGTLDIGLTHSRNANSRRRQYHATTRNAKRWPSVISIVHVSVDGLLRSKQAIWLLQH
jgi:hypothetical protein